ncbi:MAG: ammonium transporter [Thermohalobaculum sp.]|nr:ammonium transporter [Thermohalobaculum sp.]
MKTSSVLAGAGLAALLAALPAMAQDTTAVAEAVVVLETARGVPPEVGYIFTTFMFLVTGFLVMFMAAGFAMLEAGLVRSKNVAMQCLKNVALYSISALMFYVIGYNLMYPGAPADGAYPDAWIIPGYIGNLAMAVLQDPGVGADAVDLSYASVGSDFFFQLVFCATTASIVSGALAERIRLWPFLAFIVGLTGVIYPIVGSWKWGGGFLAEVFNFQDFAGSTIVHSVGGWAALAGALVLGARLGKYKDGRVTPMPGSNLTLATLGTMILWLGWFGFNGGSQLYMNSAGNVTDISRIFANTNTAAAGGALAALITTQLLYGKVDLTMVLNGALAGLVSITAEPLQPSLGLATLIGGIGGVLVVLAVPMLDRLKIDDVVGAIPVHLVCGIWGTLAVVLSNDDATVFGQLASIAIVGVFVFGASLVLWLALKATLGIRVSAEEEQAGLDSAELGMEAYPEFGKGSQFV